MSMDCDEVIHKLWITGGSKSMTQVIPQGYPLWAVYRRKSGVEMRIVIGWVPVGVGGGICSDWSPILAPVGRTASRYAWEPSNDVRFELYGDHAEAVRRVDELNAVAKTAQDHAARVGGVLEG